MHFTAEVTNVLERGQIAFKSPKLHKICNLFLQKINDISCEFSQTDITQGEFILEA